MQKVEKELELSIIPGKKLTDEEFQHKLAMRMSGGEIPSIPLSDRNSFEMVHPVLTVEQAITEADRCLYCNDVCNICVTVCPNLANIAINVEPVEIRIPGTSDSFVVEQKNQIINIGDFCNECGNCTTFCPTSGDPYKTKPRLYLSEEAFEQEDNCYLLGENHLIFKSNGKAKSLTLDNSKFVYSSGMNTVIFDSQDYSVVKDNSNNSRNRHNVLDKAIEMIFLFKILREHAIFND